MVWNSNNKKKGAGTRRNSGLLEIGKGEVFGGKIVLCGREKKGQVRISKEGEE